jgi:MFS family permease
MGFGLGAEADIVAFLVSRYFRPAIYSKVVGAVWLMFAWGYASGISLASWSHDLLGSYVPALWSFIAVAGLSAALVLRLGTYPFPGPERRSRIKLQTKLAAE